MTISFQTSSNYACYDLRAANSLVNQSSFPRRNPFFAIFTEPSLSSDMNRARIISFPSISSTCSAISIDLFISSGLVRPLFFSKAFRISAYDFLIAKSSSVKFELHRARRQEFTRGFTRNCKLRFVLNLF